MGDRGYDNGLWSGQIRGMKRAGRLRAGKLECRVLDGIWAWRERTCSIVGASRAESGPAGSGVWSGVEWSAHVVLCVLESEGTEAGGLRFPVGFL